MIAALLDSWSIYFKSLPRFEAPWGIISCVPNAPRQENLSNDKFTRKWL